MTRLLLVAAVLAILIFAGTAAAAMPPVPYFSQCDSRWSGDRLGGDNQLTPTDAAIALGLAAGGGSASCDAAALAAADVNHDGQVTALDVLMIM